MLRVYLTGSIHLERSPDVLHGVDLPGRQGRRAFAWLVLNRTLPCTREALSEAVWGEHTPQNWQAALSPLLSKLRRLLEPFDASIDTAGGTHQLRLPPDAWVDVEAAFGCLEAALVEWRKGDRSAAFGNAAATLSITRQPLLPGESAEWIELVRDRLLRARAAALELGSEISLAGDEPALALELASELVRIEPFRDSGFQKLMLAHMKRGDRTEAIRAYLQFQRRLSEEMGVDPAAETTALYLRALDA